MKYLGRIDDPKDLVTKEYVDKGDVFVAIYGETTYSQVADARAAGKTILATSSTYDSVHIFNADIGGEEFSFTMPTSNDYISEWSLDDNDTWASSQINFGTTASFYTTSSTTAATAAKTTATVSGYKLRAGNIISVKFTNANTANAPTLKVGSTTAKAIWYKGAVTSASNQLLWNAGDIVTFVYNGSIYEAISINTRALTDVTFVEYGVTSATEVYNAQGNGKLVIAFDRNSVQRCAPLVKYVPASYFYFSYVNENGDPIVWTLADNGGTDWAKEHYSYVPTTRTVNSKALSSDITLSASDVGALASDGIAERSRRLQEYDSRNVNDTPADLMSDPGAGVFSDFKTTTVINTGEAPTSAYYQVISYVPWSNNSGGRPVQMAIANKAGVPLIYTRSASSDSAWGSWKKLAFTDSDITGNAATATEADSVNGLISRLDAKTSITSLANLKTQLTTWHDDTDAQSQALFYFNPSGSWSPFTSGAAVHVIISRGTNISTATFYSRNGTTPVIAMMTYVSSTWSNFTVMATTDDINTAIGSAILASY